MIGRRRPVSEGTAAKPGAIFTANSTWIASKIASLFLSLLHS